jgi:sulfate adenylyltransferase subunit 1
MPFRFDVQQVFHAQENGFTDYRAYAGRVLSGSVRLGETLAVLPSGKQLTVTEIRRYKDVLHEAHAGDSIALSLSDEVDISRGALFSDPGQLPSDGTSLTSTLVWMDEAPANPGQRYILKSGARDILVKLQRIIRVIDPVNPEALNEKFTLELNDIAEVELRSSQPTFLDAYAENPRNGAFILIDEQSNQTVAVGLVG